MADISGQHPLPSFSKRILIIVGGYGSGKSEVSINLARQIALSQPEKVFIADLDIVNPYFRSREAAERLSELGIQPINPTGAQFHADLPIILPEIRGTIERDDGIVILDVGGDDVGAKVLGSLEDAISGQKYELLLVLNANRPFTSDIKSCLSMISQIEKSSGLKMTGIISNTHLLEDTTPESVINGLTLSIEVSKQIGLPVVFVSALKEVLDKTNFENVNVPVLALDRYLLKPWERGVTGDTKR